MDTIARVRRAFHVQGWAVKKIVRDAHVSCNTVRKILRSDETNFSYERERLTLIRIYEELRALGHDGSYDAIRRYAKGWSKDRGAATAEAYVPLYYTPG